MKTIFVRWQKEGIHAYPNAPKEVEFLKYPHRHMFFFEVEMEVFHDDREVEFILLKRELEDLFKLKVHMNHKSCEMLCDTVADYVRGQYPNRWLKVEVSEDNENGARAIYNKE